ncbi:MAG TPA: citryl-CoA lyase [Phycisphaerales bacterium]|nr:citryl-CoA lyase [Phycisphaerales bacterium]
MQGGRVTEPVAVYIGGKAAREGTRFSHAGAIVADSFGERPDAAAAALRKLAGRSLMSEAEKNAVWSTAITRIEPNRVAVRGYDIAELMGRITFGAAVHLILTGELPDERIGRLMSAVLVSSIDHGATPPSCLAARIVASTGACLSQAVGAGISAINRHHGGDIEDCARTLESLIALADVNGQTIEQAAATMIAHARAAGVRISGLGHRLHARDPRAVRLFELAAEAGLVGERARHIEAIRALERALASSGEPLPISIDGALAAVLADIGIDPKVYNGIFMIARTPGLVAHVAEEMTREKPMRHIDPLDHVYDGPAPRRLGGGG